MHTRQINWMLIATILIACFTWGVAPVAASGQSSQHLEDCTRLMKAQTSASQSKQWQLLVSASRSFLTNCRDLFDEHSEEIALYYIGVGLSGQGNFEDAVPVLVRCVTIKPDAAGCFLRLGEALEELGKTEDARKAYQQAISIGGYDDLSAAAIASARRDLATLPPENEPTQSDSAREEPPTATEAKRLGTGFFVSDLGHILTNNHVVAGCRTIATRDGDPLQVLSRRGDSDLALLQTKWWQEANRPVAVFRTGPAPKLGDTVVAFGFPLPGVLSSEGNVSTGILSATSGLGNDVRFIQISTPVQPGNSGGPLFDSSGHVIGVVVAKLDAVKIAQATGDIPQNVNFAVQWSAVRAFLDEANVPYQKEASLHATPTRNIAAAAERIAVTIECTE
jgi:S1-C subfamily serine protease